MRNVLDKYREWETDLVREDVRANSFPYACLMSNIEGDFNISSVFRNGNAFGCRDLFYWGKKKWDPRGAVGVQYYSKIQHLPDLDSVRTLADQYKFVALECNSSNTHSLYDYQWISDRPVCLVIGSESQGIDPALLDLCEEFVEIPMYGSVRSINAAAAAGIAMCDLVSKKFAPNRLSV